MFYVWNFVWRELTSNKKRSNCNCSCVYDAPVKSGLRLGTVVVLCPPGCTRPTSTPSCDGETGGMLCSYFHAHKPKLSLLSTLSSCTQGVAWRKSLRSSSHHLIILQSGVGERADLPSTLGYPCFRLAHDFRPHNTCFVYTPFDNLPLHTPHAPRTTHHHRRARRASVARYVAHRLLLFLLLRVCVCLATTPALPAHRYNTSHATTTTTTSHHTPRSSSPALESPLLPHPAVRAAFARPCLQPYGRREPGLSRDPPRRDELAIPLCWCCCGWPTTSNRHYRCLAWYYPVG